MGQYISQFLKTNLLSETIVSQAHSAFICSNSSIIRIKYEICLKLIIEATDIILVPLLLTLNIFDTLF